MWNVFDKIGLIVCRRHSLAHTLIQITTEPTKCSLHSTHMVWYLREEKRNQHPKWKTYTLHNSKNHTKKLYLSDWRDRKECALLSNISIRDDEWWWLRVFFCACSVGRLYPLSISLLPVCLTIFSPVCVITINTIIVFTIPKERIWWASCRTCRANLSSKCESGRFLLLIAMANCFYHDLMLFRRCFRLVSLSPCSAPCESRPHHRRAIHAKIMIGAHEKWNFYTIINGALYRWMRIYKGIFTANSFNRTIVFFFLLLLFPLLLLPLYFEVSSVIRRSKWNY